MIGQNIFMNSIVGQRLYQQYGEYLIYVLEPWLLSGYKPEITTSTDPNGIGGFKYPLSERMGGLRFNHNAMVVSSSSNQDSIAAGTSGAGEIRIKGVDQNYMPIEEIVALNGQTGVTSTSSFAYVTSAEVYRPNRDSSNSRLPVGDIYVGTGTISSGVNDEPWAKILATQGHSTEGLYTVPVGKELYITKVQFATPATAARYVRYSMKIITDIPGGGKAGDYYGGTTGKDYPMGFSKMQKKIFEVGGGAGDLTPDSREPTSWTFENPFVVEPTDTVFFVAEEVSNTTPVSVIAEGFLLDTTEVALSDAHKTIRSYKKNLRFKKYK